MWTFLLQLRQGTVIQMIMEMRRTPIRLTQPCQDGGFHFDPLVFSVHLLSNIYLRLTISELWQHYALSVLFITQRHLPFIQCTVKRCIKFLFSQDEHHVFSEMKTKLLYIIVCVCSFIFNCENIFSQRGIAFLNMYIVLWRQFMHGQVVA